MPRIYCDQALHNGVQLTLSREASRHVQVLRMQPGQTVQLFDGRGGEYEAAIVQMGRQSVDVAVGEHHNIEREANRAVHLAVCMPANERMDWLVEKAVELGVASITPLMSQRSVVKLSGERALKKQQHWQAIAVAACEQCGRNLVPHIALPQALNTWLGAWSDAQTQTQAQAPTQTGPRTGTEPALPAQRFVLSLQTSPTTAPASQHITSAQAPVWVLNGPEGGLSEQEEAQAIAAGWLPLSLGTRVLRAETAALAALVQLA
ncbi:MAG: 16S rRNA (uracil(1498)-N(3))-methyltransferase [Burkholderiaceae bacterium]|nr:16S rRNA (uracil(1498)-N(3))-methyltransferase [Burkholderiaceae bacterium]